MKESKSQVFLTWSNYFIKNRKKDIEPERDIKDLYERMAILLTIFLDVPLI